MASVIETDGEMATLEDAATRIIANSNLTEIEKRLAISQLLRKYRILEEYQAALAIYIRRIRFQEPSQTSDPESIICEILSSPAFTGLRLALLAALIAVIYGGGPRSAWVPWALLPVADTPGMRR